MTRSARIAARLSLAAVAAVTLGVAVAAPASGHTGQLFTAPAIEGPVVSFGTIDPTTALITPLGEPLEVGLNGIEISAETGYAILAVGGDGGTTYSIGTWDHSTGALLGSVPITLAVPGLVTSVEGLDTLPDGTLIAYVYADVEDGEFDVPEVWVASINPTTGVATFLVDITDLDGEDFYTDSLATDPVTGVTYGFIDYNDGDPLVITLDLVGGTYTGPVFLSALATQLGDGWVDGADFDTAGTLWFYYAVMDGEDGYELLASTSGGIGGATTAATAVELAQSLSEKNLAYDPAAPQLASTGFPVALVGAGGAALLGAGAIALLGRRRRTA